MTDSTQQRIQKLELDTIKAITELQKDVQSLTSEVCKLATQIQKMAENYVVKEEYLEKVHEMDKRIDMANRVGWIRSVMVGTLATVITVIITYELTKYLRG